MAFIAANSSSRMLIIADVPLVTWGIQSSLMGLPGVAVTLAGSSEPPGGVANGGDSRPNVVVVAPACARTTLCLQMAAWRDGAPPATVVCLAPGDCASHCRRADLTVPLDHTGPAALRLLLRQALNLAPADDAVGERSAGDGGSPPTAALPASPPFHLSAREREIGLLVAEGHNSGGIAERLFISQRTVDKHRANLMTKLGVSNAAGLTRELLYLCWTEGLDLAAAPG